MFKDASEMTLAAQKKQVSPKELVEHAITIIERENKRVNAVVSERFEKALDEASKAIFQGQAFFGVPLLLKDLGQEMAGEPSTCGSRLLEKTIMTETDHYVKSLERLGFIIIGRTNTPEFGFKNISDSDLHGSVNLPADISRNSGGSSGGAAAAVASGMVPLAAASDGGGSIRIPASFNGLIGLKPSRGRIPVGPRSFRGWQGASVQFALTKSVRDTTRLLYHLQTCQLESPFPLPTLSKLALDDRSFKKLRIAVSYDSPINSSVSSEAVVALNQTISQLQSLGHEVEVIDKAIIDGREAMQTYYLVNSVETALMFQQMENSLGRQLRQDDMELMTWSIFKTGQSIDAVTYAQLLAKWDSYSYQMHCFHQHYDLLLTPTTADVAPKHHQFDLSHSLKEALSEIEHYQRQEQEELIWTMFEKSLSLTPFTQQANLTGQPAISLPVYKTSAGLPLGVQLVAAKGREDILLAVARQLEEIGAFIQ
ncbi:amidase [Streptococcus sp. zg-JUN1979]|uniref:amidase n=1 Tax=Streptococcus sp. zg-JUN1979 TaxID=3391450 RepID=UPI0039A7370E